MAEQVEEVQEEKAIVEMTQEDGRQAIKWLPSSIVSFAAFDAMKDAERQALEVKNDAEIFKGIVDNILEMPMDDEHPFDRSEMIMAAAAEFSARVSPGNVGIANVDIKSMSRKEVWHYQEVLEDDTKAKDEDFQGGCERCGFGVSDIVKALDKCPYCHSEVV